MTIHQSNHVFYNGFRTVTSNHLNTVSNSFGVGGALLARSLTEDIYKQKNDIIYFVFIFMMTCRICYEPDNLTSVCKCNGSVKWVHIECVQKWIDISHREHCELCHQPFEHALLRPLNTLMVSVVEIIIVGFFLGAIYTLFAWTSSLFTTVWALAANFIFFNSVLIFLSVVLTKAKKRAWTMLLSYSVSYMTLNIIINVIQNIPPLFPFYVGDFIIVLTLLVTDVSTTHFRNNRAYIGRQ